KNIQPDPLNERRKRWIRNKPPIQMPCIGEKLQFVAMKAVAAIGEDMENREYRGHGKQRYQARRSRSREALLRTHRCLRHTRSSHAGLLLLSIRCSAGDGSSISAARAAPRVPIAFLPQLLPGSRALCLQTPGNTPALRPASPPPLETRQAQAFRAC